MIKKNSKNRSNLISLILFGLYFYILTQENSFTHSNNLLLGLFEMTWMYLVMGVLHIFIKNCDCKKLSYSFNKLNK